MIATPTYLLGRGQCRSGGLRSHVGGPLRGNCYGCKQGTHGGHIKRCACPQDIGCDPTGDCTQGDTDLDNSQKEASHAFELIGRRATHPCLDHQRSRAYDKAPGSGESKHRDVAGTDAQQAYRGHPQHQEGGAEASTQQAVGKHTGDCAAQQAESRGDGGTETSRRDKYVEPNTRQFLELAAREEAVIQAHAVTGEVDAILMLRLRDMEEYDALCHRLFQGRTNVARYWTMMVIRTAKDETAIPL